MGAYRLLPARTGPRGGLAPGALRRVREHILQRLSERIEIGELATLVGLSVCHFARAFKQSLGQPPHQFILRCRCTAAAELIQTTDRPLADISLAVGFSDQSHFTRTFSAITGESPGAFRRNHR